ncbi:MAG: hypothetical protein NT049_05360 [Planctomycetota bacterium]|nr:hypothetical protein [Planctomycetota bacterium]
MIKIKVMKNGDVYTDGKAVSFDRLPELLAEARMRSKAAWFYREDLFGEPSAVAMEVLRLVMEQELPISHSSKPDFSDYLDENGVSHPR